MAFVWVQTSLAEAFVVFCDIAHAGLAEEVVAGFHFFTQALKGGHGLHRVGDDGVVLARHLCHVVVFKGFVDTELNAFGVNQDKFKF